MGDEACEIEEIVEEEATMAAVQERRKANYNPPEFSDGGPPTSPRDISPTLGFAPFFYSILYSFLFEPRHCRGVGYIYLFIFLELESSVRLSLSF